MATTRFSRILAVTAAFGIALAGIVAVGPATATAPAKKNITLTVTELPAQVRLIPGEAVTVRLSTNRTTGYTWSTRVAGDKPFVNVSNGVYAAPTTDLIGAPGTTSWTVTAKAKGTAVVKIITTSPSGAKKNVGSLTVIIR